MGLRKDGDLRRVPMIASRGSNLLPPRREDECIDC